MGKNYEVSIIVPVHNTAGYLRKCVDSLRNQTLKNIEIILVDNLSNDGSSEICDEYALMDSRIKVIHLSVAGLSIARNAGIDIATSAYIGFIDSDDYVDPDMYQEMLKAMIDFNAELAYCNLVLESDNKESNSPYLNSGQVFVSPVKNVLKEIMLEKISCSACTKLYRRELFNSIRFPEGKLYEDRLVMHEWVVLCKTIVCVDKPFYHYVERQSSICHTPDPLNRYQFFLAEYSRLFFVDHCPLLKGEDKVEVRRKIVWFSILLFKDVMRIAKPRKNFNPLFKDVKGKLKGLLMYSKEEIGERSYKRVRNIVYFWPLYYLIHFAFKKR